MKRIKKLLLITLSLFLITACMSNPALPAAPSNPDIVETVSVSSETLGTENSETSPSFDTVIQETIIDEDGIYDTKDEVALYLHTYHHLPKNYMTKKEARKQGWKSGALNRVIPNMCIGGDVFGNYEENLPDIDGKYYECDIDTITKKQRGAKRIVWSENFDIYYTDNHYETFELLYKGDDS